MSAEITLQEVPVAPESIQRGLQAFDRRLRVVFNVQKRLWQVQERIERTGEWTHVLFWADGPWQNPRYRPLPFGAGPIVEAVTARDMKRVHRVDSVKDLAKKCDQLGAQQRAGRLAVACKERAEKARQYAAWAYKNAERLTRMYKVGGRSRAAAIQERQDALKDIGLSRNG